MKALKRGDLSHHWKKHGFKKMQEGMDTHEGESNRKEAGLMESAEQITQALWV